MQASQQKFGKLLVRMLVGAVAGFATMKFGLDAGLGPLLRGAGPGAAALAAVGLVFVVMGLFVGLGTAVPALGAKILNVAGREDIDDQRAVLAGSAVSCIALGLGMTLLALAAPSGPVSGGLALAVFALALALTTVITIVQWRRYDELWRRMSLEGAAWAGTLLALALLVWCAAAITGQAVLPGPAGLIALVMGLTLLGCFIAVGRRGLLIQG